MSYRLTAIAPCNVFIGGRTIRVEAGDRFHLKESEGRAIMNGPYKNRFVVVAHDDPTKVSKPLAEQKKERVVKKDIPVEPATKTLEPGVTEALMAASPKLKEKDIHKTPGVPTEDPLADATAESAKEGDDFMSQAFASPKEEVKEEVVEEETPEEPADEIEWEYTAHLEDDTHWSTVKNAVLDLEKEEPINYDAVREYKERYASYKAVQVECKRILEGE